MRLLLDENTSSARFRQLLSMASHEVETVVGALGVGTDDAAIVDYAIRSRRILITQDQDDFRARYGERPGHPGLIVIYPGPRQHDTRSLVAALSNIATTYPSLENLILTLNEFLW